MKKILYIMSAAALLLTFASCGNDDDFTESIFDTTTPVVDPNQSTYEFDQWLYDNFGKPYNVEIQYKFNLPASDYSFQLAPAEYKRSQLLAHFIKYLFYDVYTKYAGEDFMKQYGPRIFHFIGSSGYSPRTGTEVLGLASGGVKITLYNVNEMKPYTEDMTYNANDIETINERCFHTMHHEFSHIMHQTKTYPVTFGQVTSGTYDPIDWHERDSVSTHQMGYVTHYASSATYEDFVETLSCIITDNDYRWMMRIINACAPGFRQGDKEEVLEFIKKLGIDKDKPGTHWNNFTLYSETEYSSETGTYEPSDRIVLDVHRSTETVINKEYTAYVSRFKYTELKKFTSFDEFLNWVTVTSNESITGINAMLKKVSIATAWHKEKWGLDTFTIREEVRQRQNAINDYLKNEVTIYELK
ncbi:MAG: hypothetical protein IJV44_12350 [Prevotella sp.]|nr:hypothetical protein [Prevotella sp.]